MWYVLDAPDKSTETHLASRGSAAKITPHGVVWIAIFHHAKDAKLNLLFPKKHLTSVSPVYSRHANAVHHDLAARNIAALMNIWRPGLAANADRSSCGCSTPGKTFGEK